MQSFWHHPRNPVFLFTSVALACGLAWFMNTVPPASLWMIVLFSLFISSISYCLGMFLFASRRHALFFASGCLVYLFLRYWNLRSPFYLVLLIIIMVSLDALWSKEKIS